MGGMRHCGTSSGADIGARVMGVLMGKGTDIVQPVAF